MLSTNWFRAVLAAAIAILLWSGSSSRAAAALTYYFSENNGPYAQNQDYAKVTLTNVTDFSGSLDGVKVQVEMIVPPAGAGWNFLEFGLNVSSGAIAKTEVYFDFDGDSSFNEAGTDEFDWWNGYGTAQKMDGFGHFEYSWKVSPDANGPKVPELTFYIADQLETDFQEISTQPPPDKLRYFAAHIDTDEGTPDTWYWGTSSTTPNPTPVPGLPEPTSLAVWCLGMVAAGIGARRMRRSK